MAAVFRFGPLRECTRFLTIGSAAHAERTRFRQFQPIRALQVDGQMTGAWPVPSCARRSRQAPVRPGKRPTSGHSCARDVPSPAAPGPRRATGRPGRRRVWPADRRRLPAEPATRRDNRPSPGEERSWRSSSKPVSCLSVARPPGPPGRLWSHGGIGVGRRHHGGPTAKKQGNTTARSVEDSSRRQPRSLGSSGGISPPSSMTAPVDRTTTWLVRALAGATGPPRRRDEPPAAGSGITPSGVPRKKAPPPRSADKP
jgi:hypothetical protein